MVIAKIQSAGAQVWLKHGNNFFCVVTSLQNDKRYSFSASTYSSEHIEKSVYGENEKSKVPTGDLSCNI